MLWIGTGHRHDQEMFNHYWELPVGERNTLDFDVAHGHQLQIPLAHSIVDDVLRRHSMLAQAGRLVHVTLPVTVPLAAPLTPTPGTTSPNTGDMQL